MLEHKCGVHARARGRRVKNFQRDPGHVCLQDSRRALDAVEPCIPSDFLIIRGMLKSTTTR